MRRRNFHERVKFLMSFTINCESQSGLAGAACGRAGSRTRTSPDTCILILISLLAVAAFLVLSSCGPKTAPAPEGTSNVVGSIVRLDPGVGHQNSMNDSVPVKAVRLMRRARRW